MAFGGVLGKEERTRSARFDAAMADQRTRHPPAHTKWAMETGGHHWGQVSDVWQVGHKAAHKQHLDAKRHGYYYTTDRAARQMTDAHGPFASKEQAYAHMAQFYPGAHKKHTGVEKGMQKSQIIASQGRPSNSRSWPKSTPDEYSDQWSDNIRPGGTDYIGKSFDEHVAGYPVLMEGVETSDVLEGVVKSISDQLISFEDRMNEQIDTAFGEAAEFDHALGKSVLAIGQGVAEVGGRVEVLQEDAMQKSLGGAPMMPQRQAQGVRILKGGPGSMEGPSHEEISDALFKGVQNGTVDQLTALHFDATGEITETIRKALGL